MPSKVTTREKRENNICNILNSVYTEVSISCDDCDAEEMAWDENVLAELAHDLGWRSTPYNIYCPKCANKNKITLDKC